MENKKLPVFKLKINPEDSSGKEVTYIALVDHPAIELDWFAFNKQFKFSSDSEKRIVTGPLMVADMPIYRKGKVPYTNEEGEYYTVFDKETIFDIVQKFFRNGYGSNFNLMHSSEHKTKDVYIIESMVVDSTRGLVAPKMFKGISEGSWLITAKIDNDELWDEYVKTGKLRGFSIEGLFDPIYEKTEDQKVLETVMDLMKP